MSRISSNGPENKFPYNISIIDIPSVKTGQQLYNISHHHHHQKAFRNKSHTSHGHRPGLKRNKSKGKRLTIN